MAVTTSDGGQHFNHRLVLCTIGVGFGSISFGYAAAIIATTLGSSSTPRLARQEQNILTYPWAQVNRHLRNT